MTPWWSFSGSWLQGIPVPWLAERSLSQRVIATGTFLSWDAAWWKDSPLCLREDLISIHEGYILELQLGLIPPSNNTKFVLVLLSVEMT